MVSAVRILDRFHNGFEVACREEVGNSMKLGMSIHAAFRMTLAKAKKIRKKNSKKKKKRKTSKKKNFVKFVKFFRNRSKRDFL